MKPKVIRGLYKTFRPRQWIKNLLVLSVPLLSGKMDEERTFRTTWATVFCFTLISIFGYLINDVNDAERDALHPKKRHRPIPSGSITKSLAIKVASIFWFASALISYLVSPSLLMLILIYALIQILYSARFKNIPLIEMMLVASGFVLRSISGGVSNGIYVSDWFYVITASAAFFVVAGKRYAEFENQSGSSVETRVVLHKYSRNELLSYLILGMICSITSYAIWSIDFGPKNFDHPVLTTLPFATILMLYARHIYNGDAEAPEEILTNDPLILTLALLMLSALLFGVL